jgi:predicted nuclease of predicted toxin-antitoxin system
VPVLADLFPGSAHVREAGLQSAADPQVWEFAKAKGFVIISKDGDFRQRSLQFGPPPKVIGLLVGNCRTLLVESTVRSCAALIRRFEDDPESSFLALP